MIASSALFISAAVALGALVGKRKAALSEPMLSNLMSIGSVSSPQESLRKATDRPQKAALIDG